MTTTRRPQSTYELWREAQAKSYSGWIQLLAMFAFFAYLGQERETAAEVFGLGTTSAWPILGLAMGMVVVSGLGVTISAQMCHRHLGILYLADRKSFALAGGFDVGRWPPFVAQVGLYGAFWLSWKSASDPLETIRDPWAFIIISTIAGLVLTVITARIVFGRQAQRYRSMRLRRRR